MEISAGTYYTNRAHNKMVEVPFQKDTSSERTRFINLFAEASAELREGFFTYLNQFGMTDEADMIVIPYAHHYFYDADDLKGVKIIVNLKPLNYVREVREFLRKISDLLPFNSSFIGCFVDNKTQNGFSDKYSNLPRQLSEKAEAYENGIESRIPFINRMYSFIDAKTNSYLTKRTVSYLLEEGGLQLVGMTEMNGLTYFCTQKVRSAS